MSEELNINISPRNIFDSEDAGQKAISVWWLGQAGFAIECGGTRLIVDPYLSDYLAVKYAGKEFPHTRMMPVPIQPGDLKRIDAVLCTHRHSDHMDPGTLPDLLKANPDCTFIVPRAEIGHVLSLGIPHYVLCPMDAGESLTINEISIQSIPSAHETVKVNEKGQHHYLGYILAYQGITLYHSGDCIPYKGLQEYLSGKNVDAALLPVNGRDEFRTSKGVPGNFTADEARDLCLSAKIPVLMAHHFGMFDFNTIDPGTINGAFNHHAEGVQLIIPEIGKRYTFSKSNHEE